MENLLVIAILAACFFLYKAARKNNEQSSPEEETQGMEVRFKHQESVDRSSATVPDRPFNATFGVTTAAKSKRKPAKKKTASEFRGREIEFSYRAGSGELSHRTVEILSVHDKLFKGYCFLREKQRSFRFDRIEDDSVIFADTGEIVSKQQFIEMTH